MEVLFRVTATPLPYLGTIRVNQNWQMLRWINSRDIGE